MNYEQLMKSLSKVTAYHAGNDILQVFLSLMLSLCAIFIVGFLILLITRMREIPHGSLFQRIKKSLDNEMLILACIIAGITIFTSLLQYRYSNQSTMTLEEKQTQPSDEVSEWEQQEELWKYLKTLPKVTIPLKDVKEIDTDYGEVSFVEKQSKKDVLVTFNDDIVFNIREDDLHEDEPRESYLTYVKLTHNITYHYKKGDIVILQIVKVK